MRSRKSGANGLHLLRDLDPLYERARFSTERLRLRDLLLDDLQRKQFPYVLVTFPPVLRFFCIDCELTIDLHAHRYRAPTYINRCVRRKRPSRFSEFRFKRFKQRTLSAMVETFVYDSPCDHHHGWLADSKIIENLEGRLSHAFGHHIHPLCAHNTYISKNNK